jgi:glyoxylase-like metal-dependent hydrolase (beta-lactamase superfamily II)/rhodanese-related sulfurtransferase
MNTSPITFCSLSGKEKENYYVYQFNTSCLFQYSYYIESDKEAVIIDPIRDCESYIQMLENRGASLKYIFETHFHADFVSGHVELSKLTGAKIVFGPNALPGYEATIAYNEELFKVGKINIQVLHTPGHTMESSSLLLLDADNSPKELFTGDCLFLGEVGRPDLAVSGSISQNELAEHLFSSIQVLKKLPDEVTVYPGHGAGSACGKKISSGSSDTLGNQKKTNYAMNDNLTKEEFIEIVTSNLPTPPQYFFHDALMNKQGCSTVTSVVEASLKPIPPADFVRLMSEHVVIDSRDIATSMQGFVKGSYLITLKMTYAIWTATLFKPSENIIIIADEGKEKESITRLARVGYHNVVGYVEGGYQSIAEYETKEGLKGITSSIHAVDQSRIKEIVEKFHHSNVNIIDVREPSEWESGIIENAHLLNLSGLEGRIEEVLKLGTENQVALYCKSGARAALASSILVKHGFTNVFNIGGMMNMVEKSVPLVQIKK